MSKTGITRTHPTEAQRKMAIEAYDSGKMTSREIADLIGCHPSWVSKASLDNKRALAAKPAPQPPPLPTYAADTPGLANVPVNPPGFVHFQTLVEAVAAALKAQATTPSAQWLQAMDRLSVVEQRLDTLVKELGA